MTDTSTADRWTLRDLPFAARFTLAVFLISVGIGYGTALIQLHFQHATPGSMLPTPDDATRVFCPDTGEKPVSRMEKLITAEEHLPFNGAGQMRAAFFKRAERWPATIKKRAKTGAGRRAVEERDMATAEAELRQEREGEINALLAWLRDGASKEDYEKDSFCLPEGLAKKPITKEFINEGADPPTVKIKSLLDARCVSCHAPNAGRDPKAEQFRMDNFEHLAKFVKVDKGSAMSLDKLAQTTHVHLLGFSMLYGLTGLLFAMTRYWNWLRLLLAPLPLLAQVVDISFWWLARLEYPYGVMFAKAIAISGAVVGASLGLQILLTLFDLFGRTGKAMLILLIAVAIGGGIGLKQKVIDKHMATEVPSANAKK